MKKCLVFGSMNLDYIYSVNHTVNAKETINSTDLKIVPGGKGLNQAIALKKAGVNVDFAGCLGNSSEIIERCLNKTNISNNYVKYVDTPTGHAIIQVDKHGQNSIVVFPGSNHMMDEEFIDDVLKNYGDDDYLVLQNEINLNEYIIEKANERGLIIILNPSPVPSFPNQFPLNKISYLFVNEVEGEFYTGEKEPDKMVEKLLQSYPDLKVVLTLGGDGCYYKESNKFIKFPACPVDVIDTIGAGDTFLGYFVSGLICGCNLIETIENSIIASGISVSKIGASCSIPLFSEVAKAKDKYHTFLMSNYQVK